MGQSEEQKYVFDNNKLLQSKHLLEEMWQLIFDFSKKFAQSWAEDNGKPYREINHELKLFYNEYFKAFLEANGQQSSDITERT